VWIQTLMECEAVPAHPPIPERRFESTTRRERVTDVIEHLSYPGWGLRPIIRANVYTAGSLSLENTRIRQAVELVVPRIQNRYVGLAGIALIWA
jgi:hypothetical protein